MAETLMTDKQSFVRKRIYLKSAVLNNGYNDKQIIKSFNKS